MRDKPVFSPASLKLNSTPGETRAEINRLDDKIKNLNSAISEQDIKIEGWPRFIEQWQKFKNHYKEGIESWFQLFVSERGAQTLSKFQDTTDKFELILQNELTLRRNRPASVPAPDNARKPQLQLDRWADPGVIEFPWGTVAAVGGVGVLLVLLAADS